MFMANVIRACVLIGQEEALVALNQLDFRSHRPLKRYWFSVMSKARASRRRTRGLLASNQCYGRSGRPRSATIIITHENVGVIAVWAPAIGTRRPWRRKASKASLP